MTIDEAIRRFLEEETKLRNLRATTIKNYRSTLRRLSRRALECQRTRLVDLDDEFFREWIASWTCQTSTTIRRFSQLKSFFRTAIERCWIESSPLAKVRPPKAARPSVMPLTAKEMEALLTAARPQPKERALILLMRYSGLAIQDACTLPRAAIDADGHMTLRRAKSGELVTCRLPRVVLDALSQLSRERYFFWSGTSRPPTTANYWRERLRPIARKAGVKDFKPHRLRHTFAAELLLKHVSIEDVADLLGHSSVNTTEQYYSAWNQARRKRLNEILEDAQADDPLLKPSEDTTPDDPPPTRMRPPRKGVRSDVRSKGSTGGSGSSDQVLDQLHRTRRAIDSLSQELDALIDVWPSKSGAA